MRVPLRFVFLALVLAPGRTPAQEAPYFVTYDHHMEEPGHLEIELSGTGGFPRADKRTFIAPYLELEYGVTARWTAELYLEGQRTSGDSAIFTGWRLENRYRLLRDEHWINPVLYFEYENLNEGSRIFKEEVGHAPTFDESNAELARTRAHELEAKLILSSTVNDWNVAVNLMVEKNLSEDEGYEYGYTAGFNRPLATMASASDCRFCLENFAAGAELYGGLGSSEEGGLENTAHYLAPVIGWQATDSASFHFSAGVGLTEESLPVILRFGMRYEVRGIGRKGVRSAAGGGR